MNAKHTLSITEARKRIFDIADAVAKTSTHYTLTENGRPKAVIMSAAEFESWTETLDVMHEAPDLDKDIVQARREYERGEYATLEEFLAAESLIAADKPKQRYGVSGRPAKKRAKRA